QIRRLPSGLTETAEGSRSDTSSLKRFFEEDGLPVFVSEEIKIDAPRDEREDTVPPVAGAPRAPRRPSPARDVQRDAQTMKVRQRPAETTARIRMPRPTPPPAISAPFEIPPQMVPPVGAVPPIGAPRTVEPAPHSAVRIGKPLPAW